MRRGIAVGALIAIGAGTGVAWAWEASTTQAGLAEQAAQASRLHQRLVALGFSQGLFEPLTVPPQDAPVLLAALSRMSPSEGYVPDARGRQYAIGWLAAGAAVADQPAASAANHFFDVDTGRGLSRPRIGVVGRARSMVLARLGRAALPTGGMAAPDWIVSKQNPLGLDGFLDQYAKAARAATPGERGRAMAGALVAAGAIIHVLGDMGAPSRVRGDAAAHLERIGPGRDDLGSRFEHVAALAYGRLGVPEPDRVVTRQRLRDFFIADHRGVAVGEVRPEGLAEWVANNFFSPGTLPEDTRIGSAGTVTPHLARPSPGLPAKLNLMAASQPGGTTLKNDHQMCLARYEVEDGTLRFDLDDDCLLEQVAVILPEVAAFETGLLDFLLRGELAVTVVSGRVAVAVKAVALGEGQLEVLAEDPRGVRTSISTVKLARPTASPWSLADGAALGQPLQAPAGATRIVAVFTGIDGAGERIVAVGAANIGK